MPEPKRDSITGNSKPASRMALREYFTFSAFKEWVWDLFRVSCRPGVTTCREVSKRARNKLFFSLFMMVFSSAVQFLVYWSLRPMVSGTLRNIIWELIWPPFSALIIVAILFLLIQKGFLFSALSFKSVIYLSSIIYTISTLLLTLSYGLSPTLPQLNNISAPGDIVILFMYVLITLFGFIYTIILLFICARALIPTELWGKCMLIVYWTLAVFLAYEVSLFGRMHILKNIYFDQWYLNLAFPFLIYGIILGVFQSIVIRATHISAGRWLIATIIGAVIGTIMYCVVFKLGLQDFVLDWQIQLENNISVAQILSIHETAVQIRHIIESFWNLFERGVFILPIAVAQWLVIRKNTRYSLLWIAIALFCEELYFIYSSDNLFIFVRWVLPGIALAFLLSRTNDSGQHREISKKEKAMNQVLRNRPNRPRSAFMLPSKTDGNMLRGDKLKRKPLGAFS